MADLRIRPTLKFVKAGYICAVLVLLAGVGLFFPDYSLQSPGLYVMAAAAVLLILVARRHMRSRLVRVTLTDSALHCETGMLSKSTRIIQLSRIQDVRVDQSAAQRMFNIGSVSVETAGEAGRFKIDNVDSPRSLAELILQRSQAAGARGAGL